MTEHRSIYASAQLDKRLRRALIALMTAVALLLGLATPALAAGAGHSGAVVAAHHRGSFQPNINRLSGGSISGHVSFPLETDRLSGYGRDHVVDILDPDGAYVDSTEVGPSGDYSVEGLDPGSYTVAFARESGYAEAAAQFYDGVDESQGLADATPVVVTDGAVTPDIDATLDFGGQITGNLVDTNGQALSCLLAAFTPDGTLIERLGFSFNSNGGGAFTIGGLTSGTYYLKVQPGGDCESDDAKFLGAAHQLTDSGPGLPVTVTRGVSTSVGTLVYPSGTPKPPVTPPTVTPPTVTPPPAPATAAGFTVEHKTKVTKNPTVGKVLKVEKAQLSPAPTQVSYRWMRNGHRIKQADHRKYEVTKADRGKRLSVKIVYVRPGYSNYVVVVKVGRVGS